MVLLTVKVILVLEKILIYGRVLANICISSTSFGSLLHSLFKYLTLSSQLRMLAF